MSSDALTFQWELHEQSETTPDLTLAVGMMAEGFIIEPNEEEINE